MADFRKSFVLWVSIMALGAAGWGARRAMRSPMFTLQVIEVGDQNMAGGEMPVTPQTITDLAALPVGSVNLFDLDLAPVEARILSNPWIRAVRLQKSFPQTLSISVVFREPQALFQAENGALSYVDANGKIFGRVNLMFQPDLPVIAHGDAAQIQAALKLIAAWQASVLGKNAQISTLHWDQERGFRALVTYSMAGVNSSGRAWVDLGQEFDAPDSAQFKRLSRVFQYLGTNHVNARQIWADAGKKIVVRTSRGS